MQQNTSSAKSTCRLYSGKLFQNLMHSKSKANNQTKKPPAVNSTSFSMNLPLTELFNQQ
jgi:hypothetical protein